MRQVIHGFRNQDPEAAQQSPGLVFSPPYSLFVFPQYQTVRRITCQAHLHVVIPSLRFASCSDPDLPSPCGWLLIIQPPHLNPAPSHTVTGPASGACEHLQLHFHPLFKIPEPGIANSPQLRTCLPLLQPLAYVPLCLMWLPVLGNYLHLASYDLLTSHLAYCVLI